ncbi:MAG: ribonuclease Z [Bradyrhizobiaceae bacterium]|nr:ribonuclease Z [Bradyrhizobiaceae bacterium]
MARRRSKGSRHLSLTFLGTRGEIDTRSALHRRHSALLVRRWHTRIMIDCGADWLGRLRKVRPTAIVLTHAHPDHARGLARGAPCPVYATRATWKSLRGYPLRQRFNIPLRKPLLLGGIRLEAFPLRHSLHAPAVGYRISGGGARFFYAPDLVSIRNRRAALKDVDLYVGDGAVIRRSLIRQRKGTPLATSPSRSSSAGAEAKACRPQSSPIAAARL